MRFFSNGPNLPDSLLERRDQGRVVFLCGAGVSVNADLPDFLELTKHVFEFFDPPEESELAKAFKPWLDRGNRGPKVPLDQIFNLLYQEYGRADVNTLVAERLVTKGKEHEQSHHHKIISKISSDQNGKCQIVTTNFDLLFEQGLEAPPKIYEPPALPDINLGMPITGVTYLHGRLLKPEDINHSYVLSSADFGRAYLSEGWATNFIRSLLESYTVILVGYQAEDPPIKYLLQGLNHDERSDRSKLYAFDKGLPEEVEAKWRDRGVTAIAYSDHPDLWATLDMWAKRAEDPRLWRSQVLELAMRGPRELSPHERGMVAHVARTTPGARLFATAENIPPAEWICVFDASCRVGSKSSGYGEDAETFDPYEAYGLDDDPPRPESRVRPIPREHDHLLEWRRSDSNPPSIHRLSGPQFHGAVDMPPRLFHLAIWLTKNLNSPVLAWWALRQSGLHPRLVELIERELRRRDELHSEARHTWRLILEYLTDGRNFSWDSGWFYMRERIKVEGWTHSTLRHFENIMAPILKHKRVYGLGMSKPPLESWQQVQMGDITRWEVAFPEQHGQTLEIPDVALISVFAIKERQLHRATGLLNDIRTNYFESPTCYPEREVNGQSDNQSEEFFYSFLELFSRLIESFPDKARAYALNWSMEERYYFKKLKLFSFNHQQIFNADEAISNLLSMNQEEFWDMDIRRELLFLIHGRWAELSKNDRRAIVDRLLEGPENYRGWSDSEFPQVKDEIASRYTMWLKLNSCELEDVHNIKLERMIEGLEGWTDDLAVDFLRHNHIQVRSIGIDNSPDALINLPLNKVVKQALSEYEHEFGAETQKRSFNGLVKANPRKALASLSYSANRDDYPINLWAELLREWPSHSSPRLFKVMLHRLSRLPVRTIVELRNSIGSWLEKQFFIVYKLDRELAWNTFDYLVMALCKDGENTTKSSRGTRYVGGKAIDDSRRTYGHAIAGVIGNSLQGLLMALNKLELKQKQGIPEEFIHRIRYMLDAPGEGRDHCIALLCHDINWLHYLDPQWVFNEMIPWFEFEHPNSEPAWNGFLSGARIPVKEAGSKLNPLLVHIFPRIYEWNWDSHIAKIATQITITLTVFREGHSDGLSAKQMRYCLRKMSDDNRRDAIYRLSDIGKKEKDGWRFYVIPFINTVWPRERVFKTSSMVSSWVTLLSATGDDFPDVLDAVSKFLVPVEGEIHWLYQFSGELKGEKAITENYPEHVLELLDLIIPNSPERLPIELPRILNLIEEVEPKLVRNRKYIRLLDLIEKN